MLSGPLVSLSCSGISLSPAWEPQSARIYLVGAVGALTLCHAGAYQTVPAWQVIGQLQRPTADLMFALRRALPRLLAFRLEPQRLDDRELIRTVCQAIERRELVGVRPATGEQASAASEQQRLVRRIEGASRGRLVEGGRHHKLTTDTGLSKVADRDSYEVLPRDEARRVLETLAAEAGPQLAPLLHEAAEKLTRDWIPPLTPDGLVLLRRMRAAPTLPRADEAPITPSQMRALVEEEIIDWTLWIELDPDDPKAKDDTVILLDGYHQEIERVVLSGCPRQGSGVVVIFKDIEKHSPYTLISDYGPDEGGGQDTLFIGRSPADLEKECSRSS